MEVIAAIVFSLALVSFSYLVNNWQLHGRLNTDIYRVALSASTVLLLALVAEATVNPVYTALTGHKLWEYRVFPLYDGNVSALGLLVWTAYGIHLHFTLQTLRARLPERWRNTRGQALVIGFEAPLFAEVSGNLVFLLIASEYYAYYIPADVFHLTSFQVVPIYMLCVFFGLVVLNFLEKLPRRIELPPLIFTSGAVFLFAG